MKEEYKSLFNESKNTEDAMKRLISIVKILRKECPWDRVQTNESLEKCMLEESYEAVDAIRNRNFENLKEELGDVLLQVIMHSEIASESQNFDIKDVINDECDKMIRRHPHIFAEENLKTVDKVLEKWENVKDAEHGICSYTDRLLSVPDALPALMKSEKVQKRASEAGFDWEDINYPIEKVKEEISEFIEAYESGNQEKIKDELGDILFATVNVSRFANVDSEAALTGATKKFIKRFAVVEDIVNATGKSMADFTIEELDSFWEEAKEVLSNKEEKDEQR